MQEKQEVILRYLRENESIRKISRELSLHRNTVKKYITEYETNQALLRKSENCTVELIDEIVKNPSYLTGNRSKRVITGEIESEVKTLLEKNAEKRRNGQRKQQLKKIDIHEILNEKGYNIGYTSVCGLINDLENRTNEVFIRQENKPGEESEFDWGEINIDTGKGIERYYLAVFTGNYSNHRYSRIYKNQDTASFQESHAHYFKKVGGVYSRIVYDNMRVAVKKFVGRNEKEATDGLLKLSIYYGFSFRFCNVRKGNEKGHVERSVEYIRRKAFSRQDKFSNLEEANKHLNEVCDRLNEKEQKTNEAKTANELLREEQNYLHEIKPFFECSEATELKVDKYSMISYKTSRYSVPEEYSGKMVMTKIYPGKIICYHKNEKIASHKRLTGHHLWSIKIEHFIKTLIQKPGAIAGSLALKQIDGYLEDIYKKHFTGREKEFIELIAYIKKSSITLEKLDEIIVQIRPIREDDLTLDKIKIFAEKEEGVNQKVQKEDEITDYCNQQLRLHSAILTGNYSDPIALQEVL